jgi:hypothetical protein
MSCGSNQRGEKFERRTMCVDAMVYDNDLERLKVRRENHVRCVEGMWLRVRELES